MVKVLFICHGNICRSPMGEFVFRDMISKAGASELFEVSSAATSREEIGNDIYPPAKRVLSAHGIPYGRHAAHRVTDREMKDCDMIVAMDGNNIRNLRLMFGEKYTDKTYLLMDFAGEHRDVSDPWYTDNFEKAFRDIESGCRGLAEKLLKG